MGVNNYLPHIVVMSKDHANDQILLGFLKHPAVNYTLVRPLPFFRGWGDVRDEFAQNHLSKMHKYEHRYVVMLVDFDNKDGRFARIKASVPEDLVDRVFVLVAASDPESLKRAKLGSYEDIGIKLASDCCDQTTATWSHDLLKHNLPELERMMPALHPILFG